MTRVLILGADDAFAARINVLPSTQIVTLNRDTIESERFDLMRSLDPQRLPDLILFCPELPLGTALPIAVAADQRYPSIDLVLVGDPPAEGIIEVMRSGIRDIVPVDAPDARLVEVLRRADLHKAPTSAEAAPARPSMTPEETRTITVVSPKGGVGKTSIATNLAIGLAENHPMEVVLVDLDLQFGDVAAVLDLVPTATMEHTLGAEAASDNLVLKTMLTVHEAGFYVLPGAESPAANENVDGAQIRRLLEQLSTQFGYIVVDTAAGLDDATLAALELTDDAIFVSTMDVSCVRAVRKEVDLLNELDLLPDSRTLALNLADRQSGMKVKDVEAVIGLPVDVVIPRSSDVQLASNHGTPLMLKGRRKGGPFVKSIWALIERIERQLPASKHKRLEVA